MTITQLGGSQLTQGPLSPLSTRMLSPPPQLVRTGGLTSSHQRRSHTDGVWFSIAFKSALVAGLLAGAWGLFYYMLSRGSISHAIFAAIIMLVLATLTSFTAVALVRRFPRWQLRLATRTAHPRWRLWRLVAAPGWGVALGAVAVWGTGSLTWGAGAGVVVGSIFLWLPPLWLGLFRRQLMP